MNGGSIMNITENNIQDKNLLLALDKGIEDMENGRELPLDDAFEIVDWLVAYRGFQAKINFDNEEKFFVGEVVNISDSINFHGNSIDEVNCMFQQSIENYLDIRDKLIQRKPN